MAKEGFSEVTYIRTNLNNYWWSVPKEYYDEWTAKIAEMGRRDAEMERFGVSICCGYGVYGWKLYEKDGVYYEEWSEGTSCD